MNLNRPPQTKVWRLNKVDREGQLNISLSKDRSMGVLVLSPDFVKSFRLCHFRRKEMKSQDGKYVGIDCGKKSLEVVRINTENLLERLT
ncbi:hypothetical protein LEP1GSC036_4399 [Leptospira weilii str. 2006001853]|uniref:Transposase domain protein n=2 Tax=Leptospira weilii TaxID=28184 RepID=A0A828YXB5_9LEPT|nr:hypothetical protein LEP1GSC036_4399 [Leptospira weilii str. 2006001853]